MNDENRPKVLWIHGFAGKPNNDTFLEMSRRFKQYEWYSIEVDHHALQSMYAINRYIAENNVAIVAGTSLGGFYAMCSDFQGAKFVVNPVTEPQRDLRQFIGMNTYKPGRPDGQTDFLFTEEMLAEFGMLKIGSLDKTLCHYTAHDQLLGDDIKSDYERMFAHREMIDESILGNHFLTFKYVRQAMPKALEYIAEHFPTNDDSYKYNVGDHVCFLSSSIVQHMLVMTNTKVSSEKDIKEGEFKGKIVGRYRMSDNYYNISEDHGFRDVCVPEEKIKGIVTE